MAQFEALLKLGMTEAEAHEVLEADKRIDKGEDLFPLNEEQKTTEKKMRQADRKPTVYNFNKRERKPNEPKRELIAILREALEAVSNEIEITNPERQIDFVYGGNKYRIVLSAPRK